VDSVTLSVPAPQQPPTCQIPTAQSAHLQCAITAMI
jgi:hypothetical protein